MSEDVTGIDIGGLGYVGMPDPDAEESSGIFFWWSIGRLWRLAESLPAEDVPLADVEHFLEEKSDQSHRSLTNRDVAEKARRIMESDLSYPIIIAADGWLMDGFHRVAKAWILRHTHIKVIRFAQNPPPDYRRPKTQM